VLRQAHDGPPFGYSMLAPVCRSPENAEKPGNLLAEVEPTDHPLAVEQRKGHHGGEGAGDRSARLSRNDPIEMARLLMNRARMPIRDT
jgi:hypothetical protein